MDGLSSKPTVKEPPKPKVMGCTQESEDLVIDK